MKCQISRSPKDSLKYFVPIVPPNTTFEISVPRHVSFAKLKKKKKKIKRTITFQKLICNLTLKIRDILKILWKRGEIAP